jgi:hypothetical protein
VSRRRFSAIRQSARRASRHASRGVAAIEFALIAFALFLFLYGVSTFGAVLYTQQVISRAAEDGARAMSLLPESSALDEVSVRAVVMDSLSQALIAPPAQNGTPAARLLWLEEAVTVTITSQGVVGQPGSSAAIAVSYPYSQNRVLPTLPLFDASRWMPDTLSSQATAALEQP